MSINKIAPSLDLQLRWIKLNLLLEKRLDKHFNSVVTLAFIMAMSFF